MRLKKRSDSIPLSYYHPVVSCYYTTEETVSNLEYLITEGLKKASETKEAVVVEQGNLDHVFICWPGGTLSLYCERASFTIEQEK